MHNAKMVVNVLLIATIFSAAYHQFLPPIYVVPVNISAFLTVEGDQRALLRPVAHPQPAPALSHEYGPIYTVTATAYQAVEAQTDDEPFVTADNSFIEPGYSSKLRWLAVSQDLLVHWGGRIKYGDLVRVRGVSPELDGLYTVHDTMNKRHHHCIDILSNPAEKFDIFAKHVKLQRTVRPLLASSRIGRSVGRPAYRRLVQPTEQPVYLASAIL